VYFILPAEERPVGNMVVIGRSDAASDGGVLSAIKRGFQRLDPERSALAVAIVSNRNTLGLSELCYLRSRSRALAEESGRYEVSLAEGDGVSGFVTGFRTFFLEDFLGNAGRALLVFGYSLLGSVAWPVHTMYSALTLRHLHLYGPEFFLKNPRLKASASGRAVRGGRFAVMPGSLLREHIAPRFSDTVFRLRFRHQDWIDERNILQKPLTFDSPELASAFVLGSVRKSKSLWMTESGLTLQEFMDLGK
jgi:hypothetical protein